MAVHIGHLIKEKLDAKGKSVEWLAEKINHTPAYCKKLFESTNVDVYLLIDICKLLGYNFFVDLSNEFEEIMKAKNAEIK